MSYIETLKDPSLLLTEKYYETLKDNVTFDSKSVNIYDFVPAEVDYPYIWISSQTMDQDNFSNDKQRWAWQFTQLIEIVVGYTGNLYGGKYDIQTIQAQVIPLIVRQQQWDISPFQIMNTEVDSTNLVVESTTSNTIYRQQIRFRHSIWQEE